MLTGPEEREFAITSFKDGRKDVLIASGVGSKGLDFAEIKVRLVFYCQKLLRSIF